MGEKSETRYLVSYEDGRGSQPSVGLSLVAGATSSTMWMSRRDMFHLAGSFSIFQLVGGLNVN